MNMVTLSGNIQSENITLREMPDGTPITSFVLEVKREKRRENERPYVSNEGFDYVKIVCWNGMANYVAEHFAKGMHVEVRGSIYTGQRQLKDYEVSKSGKKIANFKIPFVEINAHKVEKV